MRENPALMALAAAYAGNRCGTPAGNAGLTQEQLAVMRERGLGMADVKLSSVFVAKRPPRPGAIPAENLVQMEIVSMPCPVMGCQLIAPGLSVPTVLMPDGQILAVFR